MIGVTTAPRSVTYLPQTLASIEAAGFARDDITIFAEPGSPVPDGYRVTHRPTKFGILHNWLTGLRELCEADAEYVCMVQDDIQCAPGLAQWLRGFPWNPRIGLVSPYCSAKDAKATGVFRLNQTNPFGACFYCFPKAVARKVAESPLIPGWQGDKRIEQFVNRTIVNLCGLEVWTVNPSLVQHCGDVGTDGRIGRASGWLAAGVYDEAALPMHSE